MMRTDVACRLRSLENREPLPPVGGFSYPKKEMPRGARHPRAWNQVPRAYLISITSFSFPLAISSIFLISSSVSR